MDALGGNSRQELGDPELIRTDALDRADRTLQHVIAPLVLAGAFHSNDVSRLLDDAQHGDVAGRISTHPALVTLSDVKTSIAERHPILHFHDGRGQPSCVDL